MPPPRFLIRTSASGRPRRGDGIRTTLQAMWRTRVFSGYAHGRSRPFSRELVVGAPLRGFPKYVKFKLSRRPKRFLWSAQQLDSSDREVGLWRAGAPRAGHAVVLSLASAGDKQVQLSLSWHRHSIRPEKPRYYLQRSSAQESETESLGHNKLGRTVGAQIFLPTNMMTTYICLTT